MKRLPPDTLVMLRPILEQGGVFPPGLQSLIVDHIEVTERILNVMALDLVHSNRKAHLWWKAARHWKALAKKLWRYPWPNRGGLGRNGCAAIDVRMKNNERTIKR